MENNIENNNDNIYILVFKNKEGKKITKIELTSINEIDFQMPEDTLWIELKVKRLNENKIYERWSLYNLITKDILENKFNKTNNEYYIVTSKFEYYPGFTDMNLKIFNTSEELENYIKTMIQFFQEYISNQTNQEIIQQENIKTSNQLSRKLKKILNPKQ